jgi:uncharacterized RDD family membrane protein YckC
MDTIVRVASPDGIAFDLHPAGVIVRMLAFLMDMLFQGIAGIILGVVLVIFKVTGTWIISLSAFILIWFYYVIFELLYAGRSPGKMILGLQVVLADGSPVTASASLLRNLLRVFDVFFAIGILVPVFNNGFRRLGDIVAGTLVVYAPERLMRIEAKLDFSDIEARPAQRILDTGAADVVLSYARRRKDFSPELRKELARTASEVYLAGATDEDPETSVLSLAAWYAGMRPSRKSDTI